MQRTKICFQVLEFQTYAKDKNMFSGFRISDLCKGQKYVCRISKFQTLLMGFERRCSKCGSEKVNTALKRTRQKVARSYTN